MKLTNLTIKDLITPDSKLTFLVGAGCSIDPPSCLPAGRAMMDAIIEYTCAESEIEKIKALEQLRFEALVEIVRDSLDPELKIIDFYGLCDKPNMHHYFLAEMIKKGHFVMTTNFDFLIEYALQKSGVPQEDIIPVITRDDFDKFKDPYEQFRKRKKTVYKIHGSSENIITNESTRESLIATIQAFGSHKEGLNIFQIEPFKRDLFNNITNERSLVVMGYSGTDDFDVVPTLKLLKNMKNFIWINYVHDDQGIEKILEIEELDTQTLDSSDKINQILYEIRIMNYAEHVYRIDTNTSRLIGELIEERPKLSLEDFSITASEWIEEVQLPNEIQKSFIPYKIYDQFDKSYDSLRCLQHTLQIASDLEDLSWISIASNNMGSIYKEQGDYDFALKSFEFVLKTEEHLGNFYGISTALNNIADVYQDQGKYSKALDFYEKALEINTKLEDLTGKATTINNIGALNKDQGKFFVALEKFQEVLKINEKLGKLPEKAVCLNNIGTVYMFMGNYSEAQKCLEEAYQIDEKLGNLSGMALRLKNLGILYHEQGNYTFALRNYEKALQIDEELGLLLGKADSLSCIGDIHQDQEQPDKALEYYEESLQIYEKLGNSSGKASQLNEIGKVYEAQGQYLEALEKYNEALNIDEELKDLYGKSTRLASIGDIHALMENYTEALMYYVDAVKIDGEIGNLRGLSDRIHAIGFVYEELGNYSEAQQKYEEALQILNSLGLSDSPNAKDFREDLEILKNKINKNDFSI